MILFSQRLKFEKIFNEWCKEIGIAKDPKNVVAFLSIRGLINEEEFLKFLSSTNSTEVTGNND